MKFITLILFLAIFTVSCDYDTGPEIKCLNPRYTIIQFDDDDMYTWKIAGYICWDKFCTLEEAVRNANRHAEIQTMDRYEADCAILTVPVCCGIR